MASNLDPDRLSSAWGNGGIMFVEDNEGGIMYVYGDMDHHYQEFFQGLSLYGPRRSNPFHDWVAMLSDQDIVDRLAYLVGMEVHDTQDAFAHGLLAEELLHRWDRRLDSILTYRHRY